MMVHGGRFIERVCHVEEKRVSCVNGNGRGSMQCGQVYVTGKVRVAHGQVPLTPTTRRGKRPSGLAFCTYVTFHQSSCTPAEARVARARRKKKRGRMGDGKGGCVTVHIYEDQVKKILSDNTRTGTDYDSHGNYYQIKIGHYRTSDT